MVKGFFKLTLRTTASVHFMIPYVIRRQVNGCEAKANDRILDRIKLNLPLVAMAPSNTIRHRAIAAFIFEEQNLTYYDDSGHNVQVIYHNLRGPGLTTERVATAMNQP